MTMDTEDGSGQIRGRHHGKANPEERRKGVSRTMGYKIRMAGKAGQRYSRDPAGLHMAPYRLCGWIGHANDRYTTHSS